jgi:hypothetical protein
MDYGRILIERTNEMTSISRRVEIALRVIAALAATNGMMVTAHAGSCDGTINAVKQWLSLNSGNYATAVVTSNKPAVAPGMYAEVTYAKIPMKLGPAGSLVTDAMGTHYYDDHSWYKPAPPCPPSPGLCLPQAPGPYPFSPDATDYAGLTISSTGTVSTSGFAVVSGGFTLINGYTFTATCSPQGVMYGEPPLPTPPPGLLLSVPFYSITFEEGTKPPIIPK